MLLGALLITGRSAVAAEPVNERAALGVVARMYGFDPDLLIAIAKVESNGNPAAVSPKGAQGLMQLMPATAAQYGVDDPFDVVENALGAARFLDHLRRWRLSHPQMQLPELLAAYNAGENAVAKYGGIPPYAETQEYVRRVLVTYLLDGVPLRTDGSSRTIGLIRPAKSRMPIKGVAHADQSVAESSDAKALDQLQALKRQRWAALERAR